MKYFSAKEVGFYDDARLSFYEENKAWPDDAEKVSDEDYIKYLGTPPTGQKLGSDKNGYPCWVDIPPLTSEEIISAAEAEKQVRIGQANEFMNSKQWPGKAAIGRLKTDELEQYNLWLDYLDALEAVDTSSAPNIDWPTAPAL